MNPHSAKPAAAVVRGMSARDFALWGMQDIAYIRPGVVDDTAGWVIHAGDGSQMGFAPTRELAFAAVRQHDIEPYDVH